MTPEPLIPPCVLALIEDDADLAMLVRLNLEREGHRVDVFHQGQDGLAAVLKGGYDALLLDLRLPDMDGLTVCRELRRQAHTATLPIVMVTGRVSEQDVITGLELGADEYVTKPFRVAELVARVGAVVRRAQAAPQRDHVLYDDGNLRIDVRAERVYVDGHEVKLARKEFELLALLVRHRPLIVERERLLADLWNLAEDSETRTVDAHVRNVRLKIGKSRIETVIGRGYRFCETAALEAASA